MWVTLTTVDGTPVAINTGTLMYIVTKTRDTKLGFGPCTIYVKESREEILKKIQITQHRGEKTGGGDD